MKKAGMTLFIIVAIVATLHAFRAMQQANIKGRVREAAGVISVFATNGIDSVGTTPVNGVFSLIVRPGNWKVLVNTRTPYRNVMLNVPVYEGNTIDLGLIRLQ
jgi:hypothetical protein